MSKKEEVTSSITPAQKQALLAHFNEIYECKELTDHEYNMIYLAWMWAKGIVRPDEMGMSYFDQEEAGVDLFDYELTIEVDPSGGVNLDILHDYYKVDKIIDLMGW